MARRRNSNRRRRRGSFGFLYKLLSILVICGVVVVALTLFFRVDTVTVTGAERYTDQQVTSASGVENGDNLILLNKYDMANRLVTELPYIKSVRINRSLPDTLLINVEECSTPMAVVQDGMAWLICPGEKTGGKLKIVDHVSEAEAEAYGLIDGCTLLAPSVGTAVALASEYSSQQQSLMDLLHALEDQGLLDQVEAIHLEDISVLRMEYGGRFTVELPYGADYDYKLQYLQATISKLESNLTGTIQLTRSDNRVHVIQD